jgi:hypothetical protein
MTEQQLRDWRDMERERYRSLVQEKSRDFCKLTISLLNAVIGDN